MLKALRTTILLVSIGAAIAIPSFASDHFDAPSNADDRGTDLSDGYMFLDPNDNTRLVLIATFAGFITPGENVNLGVLSDSARFVFEIENTGDAVPDKFIRVSFAKKTSSTSAQTATIELHDGTTFTAPTTAPSHTAETAAAPVVTTDPVSGVSFFAGLVDDPFFFDIPAFGRFVASVKAGAPDATVFQRGRDSFAGYNVLAIALSVPAAQLKGSNGNIVGLSEAAQRRVFRLIDAKGGIAGSGRWVNADRQGLPAINTALIPYGRKSEYNHAGPTDDAAGKFAADIVDALHSLGTNDTNVGILAGLAVAKGDILRIDTSIANTGSGGGTSPGAGFPNGRRLSDDVIDTILFFVANQNTLGDSVGGNDVAFRNSFPFLGASHQPLPRGATGTNQN